MSAKLSEEDRACEIAFKGFCIHEAKNCCEKHVTDFPIEITELWKDSTHAIRRH